jgi:P-type Mg2+ transporter
MKRSAHTPRHTGKHLARQIRRAIPGGMTESYSRFLHARRVLRHFGRHPLIGSFASHGPAAAAPAAVTHALLQAAGESPAAVLTRLASSMQGLSQAEAALRLRRDGPNEVAHEAPLPAWLHLWHCYKNPFNLLLSVLALLSWFGADAKATVVIAVMVLLSTVVRFVQEGRSHHAAESLRALVSNTASVHRHSGARPPQDGAAPGLMACQEIAQRQLVAGDIVALSAGDMIPADCRILSARDLFIAQAAMTGESRPVEKFAEQRASSDQLFDQDNLLFMGTSVVSGTATALVLATGGRSYFGTLALKLSTSDLAPNAFQTGVNSVSWLLIRFALVMVPIVLLVNGFTKGNWSEALLFALSVAVGLTPEMLPMIVTSTLAKGAVLLSRKKVVVKRLDAIQNFGAMDVLCTDKTGTLTQDRIALARHADGFGAESESVLDYAFLNSYYQTGLKNLLDRAVLSHVELATELRLKQDYSKIDEIPFDFERRRMSVVVAVKNAGRAEHHVLICKGAVEEVLAICNRVRAAGTPDSLLDAAARERVSAFAHGLNAEGLRVVAVAMKELPPGQTRYTVADEAALSLIGFIGFLDPPKDSAAPALKALAAHGIVVKVLSGDNELVTARVCRQVGLPAGTVLLGTQLDAMSDAALNVAVEQHQIFAKLTPLHKERIVLALRAAGHVVGFMGDGINDAPALRAADIGISVDSAVDIAKEAADVILLEKSLMVLDAGVIEGRTTFCNMLKYIRMTASSNFGNVLSVLVASAFLPFLPMLPLQLLLQNLLYDFSQTAIPFDNVDAEQLSQPLKWQPDNIARFMIFFGPISSLFDISCFALMWWVFKANDLAHQGLFQSGWFIVGLLTQTLVVHMIRTPKLPFIQSRAAAPVLGTTLLIMALGVWLPMGPLAAYFKLQPLPAAYFAWLVASLMAYCALTTLMKRLYIRRYGWQ